MAKAALCVGINDYPGASSDLEGCVNDAQDWAAALERRGYDVRVLTDRAATRGAILGSLERLVGDARPGDALVFTFSGHGSWVPDDDGDEVDHRDETLCPHDVARGRQIVDDDLAEVFGRKPAGSRLFVIADSCHSGTVARFGPPLGPAGDRAPRPRFLPPADLATDPASAARIRASVFRSIARQKFAALLAAACGDAEYAYDAWFGDRPNGVFTHVALRALEDDPPTPRAWMAAIRELLPTSQYPQTPRLFGSTAARNGPMF
jgi:uncharacterized caspase-like protein